VIPTAALQSAATTTPPKEEDGVMEGANTLAEVVIPALPLGSDPEEVKTDREETLPSGNAPQAPALSVEPTTSGLLANNESLASSSPAEPLLNKSEIESILQHIETPPKPGSEAERQLQEGVCPLCGDRVEPSEAERHFQAELRGFLEQERQSNPPSPPEAAQPPYEPFCPPSVKVLGFLIFFHFQD